jgi:hypothetical protein
VSKIFEAMLKAQVYGLVKSVDPVSVPQDMDLLSTSPSPCPYPLVRTQQAARTPRSSRQRSLPKADRPSQIVAANKWHHGQYWHADSHERYFGLAYAVENFAPVTTLLEAETYQLYGMESSQDSSR